MSIPLLIANFLTVSAFFLHTFMGDKELKILEPKHLGNEDSFLAREKWTMARCGWHWLSFDLLFASVGLALISFSNFFENEKLLLQVLAFYFFGYGLSWLIGIAISKSFPQNYLKLGQWMLCWVISGLIYWGI